MIDCEELVEHFHAEARDQVDLAMLAKAIPVVSMHLDLAEFREQQARFAEELCEDA